MSGKDMVRELDAKGFKNAATIIVYKTAFMPISLLISIYSHYNNTIEVLKATKLIDYTNLNLRHILYIYLKKKFNIYMTAFLTCAILQTYRLSVSIETKNPHSGYCGGSTFLDDNSLYL
jgi:hypothetical protein